VLSHPIPGALRGDIRSLVASLTGLSPKERKERSEEDIKKDFLMPLFSALEWDTANRKVRDEVVAERHIGNRKRVDYGFRIKSVTRFYLEAKDLKDDLESEEILDQAINYSYLKGVPWAVVSNFQRTIVLDADKEAATSKERIYLNFTAEEYDSRLADLWLLARPSILAGDLDRDAERHGKARRKPVGEQLLSDLTKFREILTKDVLRLNAARLAGDESLLDQIVQRILDRLLFMRSAEDRGLEERALLALVRDEDKDTLTQRLRERFRDFDDGYDSELFEKTIADEVKIDPEVLEKVIRGLYSTVGRTVTYDFSVIGSDVLGEVYEQYLGIVLRKTPKRAVLVGGSVHRKEQGIYYTPTYIVQHIVDATLGEVLRGGRESSIRQLRVVDPACGSGSFLMKAYDALESYWRGNRSVAFGQQVLSGDSDELVFTRKTEIIRNNIFGVDLDSKAAEIARLNLLLRISEQRKRLPLLNHNVRVGDSLISDSEVSENAFVWDREFSEIMRGGGFDVVIGNPPWSSKIPSETNAALAQSWGLDAKNVNICTLFVLRGLSLVREGGYFGFLLPKVVVKNKAYEPIRKKLLAEFDLTRILDFGQFPGVASDAVGVIARKSKPARRTLVFGLDGVTLEEREPIDQSVFRNASGNILAIGTTVAVAKILRKVEKDSTPISELLSVTRGIELGQRSVLLKCPNCQTYNETGTKYYGPQERICQACGTKLPKAGGERLTVSSSSRSGDYPLTCLSGRQIQRYLVKSTYFIPESLKGVDYKQDSFRGPIVLLKRISTRPVGTFVDRDQLCFNTVYSLRPKVGDDRKLLLRVLGLLNSRLMAFYFEKTYNIGMNLTTQVTMDVLNRFPLRTFGSAVDSSIAQGAEELL